MRIISGKFKGKKLIQPVDKCTRPLKDITKESIFNLLVHSKFIKFNFNEIDVIDLFSGFRLVSLQPMGYNIPWLFQKKHGRNKFGYFWAIEIQK